jgi:ubiquinone/menaquinone biosynthesis C-methylase UbiE
MADDPDYALMLSDAEVRRYRLMAELARAAETDLWRQAGIGEGTKVADIGCGPGGLFPAVVDAVGPSGQVTGVDADPGAAGLARALVQANGWDNVTVNVGRAEDTGLTPAAFDVVMMRHVLAHNGPREQSIVNHLASLVRPGGSVYLVDVDAGAMRTRPTDPDVEDLASTYIRFHAQRGNDLQTGLRLPELLSAGGLEVMAYRGWYNIIKAPPGLRPPSWAARDAMIEAGLATAADVERWGAALDQLTERGVTIFAPVFGAIGRRQH